MNSSSAATTDEVACRHMPRLKVMQQHVDVPALLAALKHADLRAALDYYQALVAMPAAANID
jgi:hypothetical protein